MELMVMRADEYRVQPTTIGQLHVRVAHKVHHQQGIADKYTLMPKIVSSTGSCRKNNQTRR
jgi:hypothetical protein